MKRQGTFWGMPYDWRAPTSERIRERLWNKNSHKLFTPKVFGWGYDINFYELFHHRKVLLAGIILLILAFVWYVLTIQ